MLRLSVLLGAAIYVTLLLAGTDSAPLRPGLARAVAEGGEIIVLERQFSDVAPPAATEPAAPPVAATPAPPVEVVTAAYAPAAPPPEPATRKVTPQPVFTLSTLPTIGGDVADPAPELAGTVADTPAPAAADDDAAPDVWYVAAKSVNVREGPSTDTSVVGKLANGEAVTVVEMAGPDWARILIEGDGLEGYIAARFLTPTP